MSTSTILVDSTSSKSKPKKSTSLSKITQVEIEFVVIFEEELEAGGTVSEGTEPEIPGTVAVPRGNQKGKPMPLKAADLKGKVLNLWMNVQQCA